MTDLPGGSRSDRLDRALQRLLSYTPEIEAAAVVSFDGLPMASALPASMDEDRVAAMSAALLSLGERAAEGLGRGELAQVYVEGATGTVFLVPADDEAVLVAVAVVGAKVGLMLYEVRRTAAAVAAVMRAEEPEPANQEPTSQGPTSQEPVARTEPARTPDLLDRLEVAASAAAASFATAPQHTVAPTWPPRTPGQSATWS